MGIFLLVEPYDIRGWLWQTMSGLVEIGSALLSGIANIAGRMFSSFGPSDLLGLVLIALAVVVIGWRLRTYFLSNPRYTGTSCPRCDSRIVRIHRSWWDQVLSRILFLPIYRFKCRNTACGWEGRRYGAHHRHWSPHITNEEIAHVSHATEDR